jgi:hypothetical protein|tara:strand:- start:40 stop:309 length:270 start_codon:yes stop_codon:yes gene_type:complete
VSEQCTAILGSSSERAWTGTSLTAAVCDYRVMAKTIEVMEQVLVTVDDEIGFFADWVRCRICLHEWYHLPEDGDPECGWCRIELDRTMN